MLFRKKMPRSCEHCGHGTRICGDQVLCTKHGVVAVSYKCRHFLYDPCKRIPKKMKTPDFSRFNEEDFRL